MLTLTRHTDDGFLKQLLAAGASGYALKLSSGDDLLRAIRTVSGGGTYIDPAIAERLVSSVARPAGKPGPMPSVDLTDREEEVLRMIAWGLGGRHAR